ncbi:hypothetical protein [Erwinia sp. HR93]|uniref:hypothetical protein n=1 Tax=Erwinia sp. HR93 TaxID=3094840 RepID=UPI002ADEC837|nr:hypothetical protein [Erwinia sp. HR93]MEA1063901.1 hypothetical protein [Erwinia sp. HR93]
MQQENSIKPKSALVRVLSKAVRVYNTPLFAHIFSTLFLAYMLVIPSLYSSKYTFPQEGKIHAQSGLFIYKNMGKNGYAPGIFADGKKYRFSCASGSFMQHTCGKMSAKDFRRLRGKPATIYWFQQKTNLFSSQKRVVEIVVNNEVTVTRPSVNRDITIERKSRNFNLWTSSIITITVNLLLCWGYRRINKAEKALKENNNTDTRL